MSEPSKEKEKNQLFSEFPRPLKEDWMNIVIHDLDGADFTHKLVWKADDNFLVQPMYFRDNTDGLPHMKFLPGEAPFIRGNASVPRAGNPWDIIQVISASDIKEANNQLRDALNSGQHGASIRFSDTASKQPSLAEDSDLSKNQVVSICTLNDMRDLLEGIPREAKIELQGGLSSLILFAMAYESGTIPFHTDFDPVSELLVSGCLPFSFHTCMKFVADTIRFLDSEKISSTLITADGQCFHNAGATAVQEVAFTLACAVEYLNALTGLGIPIQNAARSIRFRFSVSTNFFMEIAKLRAAKALWAKILYHFDEKTAHAVPMQIHAVTSWRQLTQYDPWVNMLRGTVESMAAAIGGADSISTTPFDEVVSASSELSRRTARNVQIILQEEAYLGHTVDPAAGSYYVEQLTDSIAEHAWSLFQDVETEGGLLTAVINGNVQKQIHETEERKRSDIRTRKQILVGTNKYPDPVEKPLYGQSHSDNAVDTDKNREFNSDTDSSAITFTEDSDLFRSIHAAVRNGATPEAVLHSFSVLSEGQKVVSLVQNRAARDYELLRNAVQHSLAKPVIFLATLGSVFWRRARATFASGFFGTAGLEVVDNIGFNAPEEAAKAAMQAGADIVVLCSDDESYVSLLPTMKAALATADRNIQVVIAGFPKDDIDTLRAAGANEFIHMKADVPAIITSLLKNFGMELN